MLTLLAMLALAGPIQLQPAVRFEFTDCSATGSAAQTVTDGPYLLRVTGEDTFLCYASTCASGGEKFPVGTVMNIKICSNGFCAGTGTSMSCRSASSTAAGDVILTRGEAAP